MRALPWVAPALIVTGLAVLPSSAVPVAAPSCQGQTATIVGTRGADRITGTNRRDVIVGFGGDDVIDGRKGDDLICGGAGADRLQGGPGDDKLYGERDLLADGPAGTYLLGDLLLGGHGADRLDGGTDQRRADSRRRPDTYSYADAPRRVVIDLSGATTGTGTARRWGADTIGLGPTHGVIGSSHNDRITGSRYRDRIDAGAGNDTVLAGGGADLIYPDGFSGTEGDDTVDAGRGNDLVNSRTGRDRINGGPGADFVEAFSERPTVVALGRGDDYVGQLITPGRGASSAGGPGDDVISFYARLIAGRFTVDQRSGTTYASGAVRARGSISGFERHRLIGSVPWRYVGSPAGDRVWAITGGPLRAFGGDGRDELTGTELPDVLDGGSGSDTGTGRGGKDTCRSIERGDC